MQHGRKQTHTSTRANRPHRHKDREEAVAREGVSGELQVAEECTHNTHGESAARRHTGGTNKRTRSRRAHAGAGTELEKDGCKSWCGDSVMNTVAVSGPCRLRHLWLPG